MKQVEFSIPATCDFSRAANVIESTCQRRDLQLGMKGKQAAFPGSTHWHFKRKGQKGTLELTLHPAERRLWAQVRKAAKPLGLTKNCRACSAKSSASSGNPSSRNQFLEGAPALAVP